MTKPITKLVAVKETVEETGTYTYPAGHTWIFLRDPETGKVYSPNEGWEVTGSNLEKLFHEIDTDDLQAAN